MNPAGSAFCASFDVAAPIVNAPMAQIAGGALAGAVASGGGLGLIGGGYGDLGWIQAQHSLAAGRDVGIGLITWATSDQPQLLDDLTAIGFGTFFISFGDPTDTVKRIHDLGGRVICQIQTITEAEQAAESGADALVAQGNEAGGHGRNNQPADELAAQALASVTPIPVLIAGGKTSGADLASAWNQGAAGIVVGTAMYATTEAIDTSKAKSRLVDATSSDTIRTTVFDVLRGPEWPPGYNGRAINNDATRQWHNHPADLRSNLDTARTEYNQAAATQDLRQRVIWAGTGLDAINTITPAADLVRGIIETATRIEQSQTNPHAPPAQNQPGPGH